MADEGQALQSCEFKPEQGDNDMTAKRQKLDDGSSLPITHPENPHYAPPSKVVHVRGLIDIAREQDIVQAISHFGQISCLTIMPKLKQALVEFEDIESARNLVSSSQSNLHEVFQGFGFIQRIVIFRKNGLQAMIEFENQSSAQQAKDALDGWDLYEGSNTLKIEYAKAETLNVYKNDHESWDYTRPHPEVFRRPPGGRGRGLLSRPAFQPRGPPSGAPVPPDFSMQSPRMPIPGAGTCVLMAYGFDPENMSCETVFNLLCPFGNVLKVKILTTKPGCAMVEMSDHVSCTTIIQNLSGFQLMGRELRFGFSKQTQLTCPPNHNIDTENSFKDFFDSKLHRFTTAEACSKNRVFSPTRILHFYNAPPDSTEESLLQLFDDKDVTKPTAIKIFPDARKSATGLMEWADISTALEALMIMNHTVVRNADARTIFTIKLAFSSASSIHSHNS